MNSNPDRIRSFVAIELTADAKAFLASTIQQLKPDGPELKWVRPEAIHLTLKFLGNVDRRVIPELERALSPVFASQTSFDLSIRSVGAFPSASAPRVVWAGLVDSSNALPSLAEAVEDAVEALGFSKEKRPFKPHLTLGRAKSPTRVSSNGPSHYHNERSKKDRRFGRSSNPLSKHTKTSWSRIYPADPLPIFVSRPRCQRTGG